MKLIIGLLIIALMVVLLQAQTTKLGWDETGPDLITVAGYTYAYYDNNGSRIILIGVICTGITTPFHCTVSKPLFSNGRHSIVLTAANSIGESPKSSPFVFDVVDTPVNLRFE